MYSYQLEQQKFWKNLGLSLVGHGIIVLIAILVGKMSFSFFNNEKLDIIHAAVRVDIVGMPKYTIQELKEIQEKIANSPVQPAEPVKGEKEEITPKKEEVPEDVIKEGDLVIKEQEKPKKKSSLNSLLSNYSDKKVKPKKEVKQGSKEGSGKELDALIIEGNRLSKGSSLVGDYSDTENSAYVSYVQSMPELIKPYWKLPSYLLDKNLRCRIRVYIGAQGQIIKTEINESSGQPEFDTRAEMSIKSAAPFPAPTPEVATQLSRSGVILGFPL